MEQRIGPNVQIEAVLVGGHGDPDALSTLGRLGAALVLPPFALPGRIVRHEALFDRVGWKSPPPGCRSSPVKLEAAWI